MSDNEEAVRAELLKQIEAARKEVETQLRALHDTNPDSDAARQGHGRLQQLNALRDQLVGGAKGMPSAALRANVSSAVADSHAYTSGIGVAGSSSRNDTAQLLSMSAYQQATTEWDRKIARSYVQESQHLAYAHEVAARYGIDISAYEQERLALESERDEARRRGDKLGERKDDALVAQNTVNTLTGETDAITDPAERKKHLIELYDMQRIAQERRAALEAQIELEARRTAAEQHLSPKDTGAYVDQFKKDMLAEFEHRAGALKGASGSTAAHAELETALRSGASANAPAEQSIGAHPITAKLTPDAIAKAREVGAKINAAHDKTAGSLDDSALPAMGPSEIKLATTADAHKTIEVPRTAHQGGTSSPSPSGP